MHRQSAMRDWALYPIKCSWNFAKDTYMEDVTGQRRGNSIVKERGYLSG